jgi:hypothetical protein
LKRLTPVKALLFKKAKIIELPTNIAPCEIDKENGQLRWFVAAKMPRPLYLCDFHYLEIRDKLEKTLSKVVSGMLKN